MNQSMAIHLEQMTVDGLLRAARYMTDAGAPGRAPVTMRRLRNGGYDLAVEWGVVEDVNEEKEAP